MGCGGSKHEPGADYKSDEESKLGFEPGAGSPSVPQAQDTPEGETIAAKAEYLRVQLGIAPGTPITQTVSIAGGILGIEGELAEAPTLVMKLEVCLAKAKLQEMKSRHAALEKALRDAMPGWLTGWTERHAVALQTAIEQAEAAAPPEVSTLFAALLEAKQALRGQAEAKARKEAEQRARREAEEKARFEAAKKARKEAEDNNMGVVEEALYAVGGGTSSAPQSHPVTCSCRLSNA